MKYFRRHEAHERNYCMEIEVAVIIGSGEATDITHRK